MAAPDYVPTPVTAEPRVYQSPPWRGDVWVADRPAEIAGGQPNGARLGDPGPDQGYALRLARQLHGRLLLTSAEDEHDAIAGCVAIAMRRAASFGRGPTMHDLTVAFTLWGFLSEAPAELVALRTKVFAAVGHAHHYMERRAIVDVVPEEVLRLSPADVAAFVREQPSTVLDIARAAYAAQGHDDSH